VLGVFGWLGGVFIMHLELSERRIRERRVCFSFKHADRFDT